MKILSKTIFCKLIVENISKLQKYYQSVYLMAVFTQQRSSSCLIFFLKYAKNINQYSINSSAFGISSKKQNSKIDFPKVTFLDRVLRAWSFSFEAKYKKL